MRTLSLFITACTCALVFSGCASNQAQTHLKMKELDKGIMYTSNELKNDPSDSTMNFYHGRFLYKQKKYKEAIVYFKKANDNTTFQNTNYKMWLGIAYGKNKEFQKERAIYLDLLNQKAWRYKKALAYLGRNYYKDKQYDKAIETFELGIAQYDKPHSYMLYYYALALKKMGETKKSTQYFKEYMHYYPDKSLARGATYSLNKRGIFTHVNIKIGEDILSIKNMDYLEDKVTPEYYSKKSLAKIATKFLEHENLTLYIVAYEKNSLALAEKRVKNIKVYLLDSYPEIKFENIKIAWLKSDKDLVVKGKTYTQDSFVNFFTKRAKDTKWKL